MASTGPYLDRLPSTSYRPPKIATGSSRRGKMVYNGGELASTRSQQRGLSHSQSLHIAKRAEWSNEGFERRQSEKPQEAYTYNIPRSATLPHTKALPTEYETPHKPPPKQPIGGKSPIDKGSSAWSNINRQDEAATWIRMQDLMQATPPQCFPSNSPTRPSYVSIVSNTTMSSTANSELLRMSDSTKGTSISQYPNRYASPTEREPSIEMTVDDAIDMYAAGFEDDMPPNDFTSSTFIENEEQRRSRQISEAMNDSILLPPPKPFGGRESIATTRNSLAIISNAAHSIGQTPTIPPLLPPTATQDQYGFLKVSHHVSITQYEAWHNPYAAAQVRRAKKWQTFMRSHDLLTYNPTSFPRRSPKTQRFIRKGIPPEWRGSAWYYYSGASSNQSKHPDLYPSLISRSATSDLSDIDKEHIERDLHRTFPDNIRFKPPPLPSDTHPTTNGNAHNAETPLLASLRRVLRSFAIHSPDIGYCQSLNFIGGLLLLFLPEEKAFWMLHLITREYLPGTHGLSLEGANIDLWILMSLLKNQLPHVWSLVATRTHQSHNTEASAKLPPVSLCCTSWFMALFIGALPIESTLRIWDILFYEGPHTIFRVAVGIFRLVEPKLNLAALVSRPGATIADSGEIFQIVQNLPRGMLDVGLLLKVSLDSKGAVSKECIEKMRREGDRGRKMGVVVGGGSLLSEKTKVKRGGSLWRKKPG